MKILLLELKEYFERQPMLDEEEESLLRLILLALRKLD